MYNTDMDIGKIKKLSKIAFDIAQAKRNALEGMRSRQVMAYNERLFLADAQTINLVSTLKQHRKDFHVLDVNDNPCHIQDPEDFLSRLIERNQETLNNYQQIHKDLAKRGQ